MKPFDYVIQQCLIHANEKEAPLMKAYMKNKFDFFGIKAPFRKVIVKSLKDLYGLKIPDSSFWELIYELWANNHRECQYIAIDLLQPIAKKLTPDHLSILENMIKTKSWWDTVDVIAPALVGEILKKHPEYKIKYIYRWMNEKNVWLQRSSIIFQLKYGSSTDWDLLTESILKNDTSKEFFIRKAQGWALRQYSKYEPVKVKDFVEANPQLSNLTKKEALRNLFH